MSAYEPDLTPRGRTNVYCEHTLKCTLVFGSSVLSSVKGRHLSVARNSAGKYTVTFPRTYAFLTGFRWGWSKLAAGAVYFPVVLTDAVATATDGCGTLVLEIRTEAGTVTDPASGDELVVEFDVTNDALNDDEY